MPKSLNELIVKAVAKPQDTAAAAMGAGIAYMTDAFNNFLPYVDPIQAAAPGALLGAGLSWLIRGAVTERSRRLRIGRARDMVEDLDAAGRHKLARKMDRTLDAYDKGQLASFHCEREIAAIVAEHLRDQRADR